MASKVRGGTMMIGDTAIKTGARKKGKGQRKYGRSKRHASSQRYTGEARWVKNRERRIARHLKLHPGDTQAKKALHGAASGADEESEAGGGEEGERPTPTRS